VGRRQEDFGGDQGTFDVCLWMDGYAGLAGDIQLARSSSKQEANKETNSIDQGK